MNTIPKLKDVAKNIFQNGIKNKTGEEFRSELNAAFSKSEDDAVKMLKEWTIGFPAKEIKSFLKSYSPYERRTVVTEYAFILPQEEFLDILSTEAETGRDLGETLSKLEGVMEVDYNGHFGSRIYVKVDSTFDTKKTEQEIGRTIYNFRQQ